MFREESDLFEREKWDDPVVNIPASDIYDPTGKKGEAERMDKWMNERNKVIDEWIRGRGYKPENNT